MKRKYGRSGGRRRHRLTRRRDLAVLVVKEHVGVDLGGVFELRPGTRHADVRGYFKDVLDEKNGGGL